MINIPILSHNFHKTNLFTCKGGYDEYRCDDCGLEGKRHSLGDMMITVKKDKQCVNNIKPKKGKYVFTPRLVKLTINHDVAASFGLFNNKVMKTVECPLEYQEKFGNDYWVYSPTRKEPVRLLNNERVIIPFKTLDWFNERCGAPVLMENLLTGELCTESITKDKVGELCAKQKLGFIFE